MSKNEKINISLPASLQYSALAREMASETFHLCELNELWRNRLKLVVDELFMNAVKYGSTENKSVIQISIEHNSEILRFTIEDDGTGPKAISAEELTQKIKANQEDDRLTKTSGRGLSLITQKWTDKLEISPSLQGGIKITFEKEIKNQSEKKPEEESEKIIPCDQIYAVEQEIDKESILKNLSPDAQNICLDLNKVEFINSILIGQISSLYANLIQNKKTLNLINLNIQAKDTLEVVGLLKIMKYSLKK